MASRNVWTATELRELLIQRAGFELSLQSVDVLMKKSPVQVKMATLQALCTTLRCTPNELFGVDTPGDVSLVEPRQRGVSRRPMSPHRQMQRWSSCDPRQRL